jgi:MFS family permease
MPIGERARKILTAAVIGVAAGAALPFIDVAIACRAPESEACVWGKAYLPLSLGISIAIIGSAVAMLVYALLAWRSGRVDKK